MADKKVKDPRRVRAGKKAKNKGAKAEREIVRRFEEWWGCPFARVPRSGGWGRTQELREGFNACGDVATASEDFPFTVEVKNQEGWTIEQVLTHPNTSSIVKWWKQTLDETPEGKLPLLLFTRNLQPWFMALDLRLALRLVPQANVLEWRYPTWKATILIAERVLTIPKETVLRAVREVEMGRLIRKGLL